MLFPIYNLAFSIPMLLSYHIFFIFLFFFISNVTILLQLLIFSFLIFELKRTTSNGRSVGVLKLEGLCKREVEENLILIEGLKT
ncbi:hypothetical protein Lalb_Chr11g0066001 [Lupinus albus]|uniref:Uncharacterized protein n=1 Tax=Lupinus albus TaxID=3870 RepID=A0A6A4PQM5_LUPAL|nr:hypothetical protein Lalb_Chr11g0066001 [Lupinus albus]